MKPFYTLLIVVLTITLPGFSQVTLTGTTYTENFNNLSSGLPMGFSISTSATANTVGTAATFITAATAWNVTGSGFKNYASATGLTQSSPVAEQAASTDRALGIRQTGTAGTGGDPGAAVYFQIANTVGLQNLQLTFDLQSLDVTSPRVTTWQVQYAIGANPTTFTSVTTTPSPATTGGSTFSSTSVTASFGSALNNISDVVWIRIVSITASTGTGNRATSAFDNFTLTYSSLGSGNSASIATLTNAAEPATNGSFVVTLSSPAPAGGVTITYNLSGTAVAGVDYTDPQNGQIYFAAGTTTKTVQINVVNAATIRPTTTIVATLNSATGGYFVNTTAATISRIDKDASVASYYSFNSCSSSLSDGFTAVSVTGAQVWTCTTSGLQGYAVQINGFSNGAQINEDWLISPATDLSGTTNPILAFWSRSRFLGNNLRLYITTNYTGDVNTTTWTELNGRFPSAGSDVWTYSENISLAAYKQPNVRIAFRYTSTSENASLWQLDDVYIFDAVNAPAASVTGGGLLDFRFQNAGTVSGTRSFTLWANNVTSTITLTAPAGFQLSRDGATFANTISFTAAEVNNQQLTIYTRFTPLLSNTSYGGYVSFTGTGLNSTAVLLKGSTVPLNATLNVVNWNIEWFGSTASGQGPTDVTLQAANVKRVIEYLDADVYAFEEIVDTALFGSTIRSIGGYSYTISNYASLAYNPADPSFATNYATGQKLALVYKTSVMSNITSRGLLLSSANAVSNWSTGRVPLLVSGTVTKNGGTTNMDFIVVHAKSGSTQSDYDRRKAGARELKDTLDAFFSTRRLIILGDFNDDLDRSIYTASGPLVSSFDDIIRDSTDENSYSAPTLILSYAGLNSTAGNAEMIDHVIISNEVYQIYVPYSATLYTDIATLAGIADYANTTSDHFPVMTRYLFTSTLPVELVQFNAEKQNQIVKLSWSTAGEINTSEFIVEKSTNARDFNSIGRVAATGDRTTAANYSMLDNRPVTGVNFYRLKIIDANGSAEYSNTINVNFGKVITFTVSPNPARNSITVVGEFSHPTKLQIVDLNGRVVKEQILNNASTPVHIQHLTKGLYIVRIAGDNLNTQKLVVE